MAVLLNMTSKYNYDFNITEIDTKRLRHWHGQPTDEVDLVLKAENKY